MGPAMEFGPWGVPGEGSLWRWAAIRELVRVRSWCDMSLGLWRFRPCAVVSWVAKGFGLRADFALGDAGGGDPVALLPVAIA